MPASALYSRGQGGLGTAHANGQYLPKLGGAGAHAGLASSQAQLASYSQVTSNNKHAASSANMPSSQLHYQQQHLLQQSSSS